MTYRIAVGGIHIESSTFTPYISSEKDFTIRRGAELSARYPWFCKYADKAKLVPLIHARALPGGVVSRAFFEKWLDEFLALLKIEIKAGLDGILFDIHGAMAVEGLMDAEGFVAEKIRELAGDRVIISAPMDLHGNVSDRLFFACDLLTCYRTAPHIDEDETRERAFAQMLFALEHPTQKIHKIKVDIPILLPGEKTSTEVEPGKSLYKMIEEVCEAPAVMDAAIWMGFPWADEARCHAAVVVLGTQERSVLEAAKRISEYFWEKRDGFSFVGPADTAGNAVEAAICSEAKPFFISDTGDNPGAGGAGDMNILLREFCAKDAQHPIEKKVLFASVCDREAIERIYESKCGDKILLELGGKMDRSFGGPIELVVEIDRLFEQERAGRSALVRYNNFSIILTEKRFQYGTHESFVRSGIRNFSDYDIIVVKMGYLEPDLSRAAQGWVMALTPGAVPQDIVNIEYKNLKRPLFPFDSLDEKNSLRTVKGEPLK